ncbi:hypothetical protein O9992_06370 [Vibrio lentus]|nr:hypothetical protein [Vibrio lentus]
MGGESKPASRLHPGSTFTVCMRLSICCIANDRAYRNSMPTRQTVAVDRGEHASGINLRRRIPNRALVVTYRSCLTNLPRMTTYYLTLAADKSLPSTATVKFGQLVQREICPKHVIIGTPVPNLH